MRKRRSREWLFSPSLPLKGAMARMDSMVDTQASNAAVSWVLVAVVVGSVIESLLEGEVLWAGFLAVVVTVALVPGVVTMDYTVMVSWEVLFLSGLPALAMLVDAFVSPFGYLSVAALGLLVVAEIDRFSSARMPGWFAASLVVMATMSVGSVWAIVRYFSNRWLATAFETTVDALMWDLIIASAVGIVFGVLFELVLRTREAV